MRNGLCVIAGGWPGPLSDAQYININSRGNGVSSGNLTVARSWGASAGTSTRALAMGGYTNASNNTIDYVEFASKGNYVSFGTLSTALDSQQTASTNTRVVIFGGKGPLQSDRVSTISSLNPNSRGGNTNFGNLPSVRYNVASAGNTTRAIIAGGETGGGGVSKFNTIDFFTMSSGGNTSTFGTLSQSMFESRGVASQIRFLNVGGRNAASTHVSSVFQVSIASAGNSTNFGNLSQPTGHPSVAATLTRAVVACGTSPTPGIDYKTISYFTFSSAGNSTNFGDTTIVKTAPYTSSNSHAGLTN